MTLCSACREPGCGAICAHMKPPSAVCQWVCPEHGTVCRPAPKIIPPPSAPWVMSAEERRDALVNKEHYDALADNLKSRDVSPTGAVRDSDRGRGAYELISPIMMERVAKHLEKGAQTYEPRNWEKGMSISRCFRSLMRHTWQALQGMTDEDHLAAVICNAMFIMHILEMIKRGALPATLDDRPSYGLVPAGEPDIRGPGKPDRLGGKPCRTYTAANVCHKCGDKWPECGHD